MSDYPDAVSRELTWGARQLDTWGYITFAEQWRARPEKRRIWLVDAFRFRMSLEQLLAASMTKNEKAEVVREYTEVVRRLGTPAQVLDLEVWLALRDKNDGKT